MNTQNISLANAKMNKSQYLNLLAINLLEITGNIFPTQQQIDQTEALLDAYRTAICTRSKK